MAQLFCRENDRLYAWQPPGATLKIGCACTAVEKGTCLLKRHHVRLLLRQ